MSLWVYDEVSHGLHPSLRKIWSLIVTRIIGPLSRRFKWGYLFGALEVEGVGNELLYTEGLGKDFDALFIKHIAMSNLDEIHVIIGDGAGFHHKQNQDNSKVLPSNVRVLTIPPYSSELNSIEKLWDVVTDSICNIIGIH